MDLNVTRFARSILAVLLLTASCRRAPVPSAAPTSYSATVATGAVAEPVTLALHDGARGKDVAVYSVCPVGGGPYPVIVFSHGNQSAGRAMAGLFAGWAAHGYVCLAPTHDDTVSMRAAAIAAGATPESLPGAGMIAPRGAGTDSVLSRARDVSFLLDSLDEIGAALHVSVDRARIGVGGHSSGAYTAMLLGGTTAEMDGVPAPPPTPAPAPS